MKDGYSIKDINNLSIPSILSLMNFDRINLYEENT
jgi:hypothetical protein